MIIEELNREWVKDKIVKQDHGYDNFNIRQWIRP